MPLIGAADVSLRGLRSPEGDEQKAFWSYPSGLLLIEFQKAEFLFVNFCKQSAYTF